LFILIEINDYDFLKKYLNIIKELKIKILI